MKKRKQIQFHKKHRILAMLLGAAALALPISVIQEQKVYADEDATTEVKASEGTTEKTSEGDSSTDITTNLLKDEHGRIVFWEWTKVTPSNYMQLFNRGDSHFREGTFYASMLVMHDSQMNPQGFVSTYADKEHIFYGPDELTDYATFDRLGNGDTSKVDAIYKMLDEGSGTTGGFKTTACFSRDVSSYILLDSDSQLLNNNKEVFSQDKFYTSGTPMGVLYFSPVNRGMTSSFMGEDLHGYLEVPMASMQIALPRSSAKGNSGDMSYNDIGKDRYAQDQFLVGPLNGATPRLILKNEMEELTTIMQGGRGSQLDDDDRDWVPKSNESSSPHNLDEKVDFSRDIAFYGMYAYKGDKNSDKWVILGKDGFSFLAVKDGYLLNLGVGFFGDLYDLGYGSVPDLGSDVVKETWAKVVKNVLSATDPSIYNVFSWYIGVPHVFASVKGEGGDPVSGVGGTTTIAKGETLVLMDTSYVDASGNTAKSEGVVLPEGSTIMIEEGGVLSIQGNFINNGKIINKGGTIIVKDGGCVSPFGTTSEGTIECGASANGQGGDIIIMPGGRLFSLVEDSRLDVRNRNLGMNRVMKGGAKPAEPALLMTGGSSLINYGAFVTNMTKLDGTSRIENRKEASAFLGYNRDSTSALLYRSQVRKDSVDHVEPVTDPDRKARSGVLPLEVIKNQDLNVVTITYKGTVYTEPTANLKLSMPMSTAETRADYKVPEY